MTALHRYSALLAAILAPVAATGCSGLFGSDDDGNVRVVLSASDQSSLAPSLSSSGDDDDDDESPDGSREGFLSRVETAEVTLASILARNLDGVLIDLEMDLPQVIDVKALYAGGETTLPAGSLPAGSYDQLVVVMTQVELTYPNGGALALTPPGGGWTSIVRVTPFTIVEGQDATIELQFRMGGAFREMGGVLKFFPDFNGKHR